jgi:hypothetical protein
MEKRLMCMEPDRMSKKIPFAQGAYKKREKIERKWI